MKIKTTFFTLATALLSITFSSYGAASTKSDSQVRPVSAQGLSASPKGFIPNVGQLPDAAAKFVLRDRSVSAYFTEQGFVLWTGQTTTNTQDGRELKMPIAPRWELVGARPVTPVGGETFAHTVSFFRGNDPAKWHANVPAHREIIYPEILKGVEMRVESRERGFEYTFHIKPHTKPDLRFRYDGITGLETSLTGDLIVRTATGHFTESRPVAFQWIDGSKRDVASSFEIVSAREYRIAVGPYDERHELIVDPVLDWSTSVGGSYGDQLNCIKVDPAGDVVIAGLSYSVNLPTTSGFAPFDTAAGVNLGGDQVWHTDVYIAKFSADGTQLRWAGYLGGAGATSESIGRNKTLAVDAAGDVYITTHTRSVDFPVQPAGNSSHQGGADVSITKIKGDGSEILWSRLIGNTGEDYGFAVAVHGSDLYLAGVTTSPDFPASRAFGGMQDVFVAKLNAADGADAWASFLGGSLVERVYSLEADATGVIVFGNTDSANFHAPDFPAPTGHDRTLGGSDDAFLTKFSSAGAILWSTYLGGSASETFVISPIPQFPLTVWGPSDMALDSTGNIVVAGSTLSGDFPNTAGRYQPALNGAMDAYVAKLAPDGSQVLWATYLGGSGPHDRASSMAVNEWDEILLGGATLSLDFPTTADALKPAMQADGFGDGFLAKLDPNAQQLLYSTYIGNDGWDDAVLALAYGFGNVRIGGWHYDTFFEITEGTFRQECNNCGYENFLMSFLDAYLAHDGFESGNYTGGSGWAGNWTASGDISILTSSSPHSGSRHVRLRSGTGYLQRTVNVPPGTTTLRLGFWAKVNSFEGSDRADVLVRSTGASFTTVASFTSAQGDNQYHYYELDLTPFLPASQIHIAFDAAMNASNDNWYLDDIRLTGTSEPVLPVASAGADQTVTDSDNSGVETVTLNGSASTDPDGGSIVSYEWTEGLTPLGSGVSINTPLSVGVHTITLTVTDDEGATHSDTVQVTVNPYVAPIQVFADSFEVSEWNGLWTEDSQNDWFRSSQRATQGTRSAEVDGSASDASLTSIAINLQGRNNATITFDWYIESGLDSGEYLQFHVSTNGGSTWTQKAILRGNVDPENSWRSVTVEMPGISQLRLQFRGKMNQDDEDANVDNVRVVAH